MDLQDEFKIDDFKRKHPNSKSPLNGWVQLIKEHNFEHMMELKKTFNSVDYVKNEDLEDLYVFDIGGSNFRLTASIVFKMNVVTVVKVETHDAYSKKGKRKQ